MNTCREDLYKIINKYLKFPRYDPYRSDTGPLFIVKTPKFIKRIKGGMKNANVTSKY